MKYLVTGASGFLGHHICLQLLKEGHEVWGLYRTMNKNVQKLLSFGLKATRADITNSQNGPIDFLKDAFLRATQEGPVDGVFHTAAKVGAWGSWHDFYACNVDGTRRLLNLCHEFKIKRFIYTSSPSVVFEKESLTGSDESLPYASHSPGLYAKSKAIAEELVLKTNNEHLMTMALRPHLILGPGDQHLLPRLIEMHKKKRLKIIGDGQNVVDIIHVSNAAKAHIMAMEKMNIENAGKAYFLGQDEPVKLWPFINELMKSQGLPPVTQKIPAKLAYWAGAFFEFLAKTFHYKEDRLPMTRFVALQLSQSHYFSHKAFVEKIGNYQIYSTQDLLHSLASLPKQE